MVESSVNQKKQRRTFEENVELLKIYIQTNKKYPNKRDVDGLSKQCGYFLNDLRSKYTNSKLQLSAEKMQYVESQIPGFVWSSKRDSFSKKVDELKQFLADHIYWPRRAHSQASQEEKSLSKFVAHVRNSYKYMNDSEAQVLYSAKRVPYKLDEERLKYLLDNIPSFELISNKEARYKETAIQLSNYIREHQRLPRKSGANRSKEEQILGTFISNLKQSVAVNRSTLPDIFLALDQYCPEFNYKHQFLLVKQ